jgi:hypothetical protein
MPSWAPKVPSSMTHHSAVMRLASSKEAMWSMCMPTFLPVAAISIPPIFMAAELVPVNSSTLATSRPLTSTSCGWLFPSGNAAWNSSAAVAIASAPLVSGIMLSAKRLVASFA